VNPGHALAAAVVVATSLSGDAVLYPPSSSLLECGSALAVRDVVADRRPDALVGCSSTNVDAVGGVLVFAGRPGSFRQLATIRQPTPQKADGCGAALAVGDVDADARLDVAVGCYADVLDPPEVNFFVAFNRGEGRFGVEDVVSGRRLDANTGCKSALQGGGVGLGDVNGDGRADLVIGCPEVGDVWGAIYVLTRSESGFDQPVVLRRGRVRRFAGCGWRVAVADVNRDGRGDVITSCPYDHVATSTAVGRLWRQGTVMVFRRNAANTGFLAPLLLAHPRPRRYMECGRSLAVGDVDGDRRADVIWGCYRTRGVVVSLAGKHGFRPGTVVSPVAGSPQRERCGESVALGDVGGDRGVDVVVGCGEPEVADQPAGAALIFRQLTDGHFARPDRLASGSRRPQDSCGRSIATAGSTILIGCPGTYRGQEATGAVRVLRFVRG